MSQEMGVKTFIPQKLSLTQRAIDKAQQLIKEEGNANLMLRIYITGGGCSGFQYGFSFDSNLQDDDTVVDFNGIKLVVDAMSFPYIVGSKVDYEEELSGSKFIVKNPNAISTCGCGASFSI